MILVRTPLRLSFAGGGSDLPAFYRRRPGAVVSVTIDRHVCTLVQSAAMPSFSVSVSGSSEHAWSADEITHPVVRECVRLLGASGLQVASVSAVPPGTGLGSSSAFAVSLLHAIHRLEGERPEPGQLAREACEVEIDRLGEPIGKQDQYAAAYGGMNFICFEPDGSVTVTPVAVSPETMRRIEEHLLMFYVGQPRAARSILKDQNEGMADPSRFRRVEAAVALARHFRDAVQRGRLDELGPLLHDAWMHKREVHSRISTGMVDECYVTARRAGAAGGKLLGAGGGGFLLVFADPERQAAVRAALDGIPVLPVRFTAQGSTAVADASAAPPGGDAAA